MKPGFLLWIPVLSIVVPLACWAGDGVVALQGADASCRSTTTPPPIYVDCGNGTVTDNRTGLVWLREASCWRDATTGDATLDWHQAVEIVSTLGDIPAGMAGDGDDCGLSDGSKPGEWRLATIAEWQEMIADAAALGCVDAQDGGPAITNDFGDGCWTEGVRSSFTHVMSAGYFSATTVVDDPTSYWGMGLAFGAVSQGDKMLSHNFVWAVRDSQ